MCARHHDQDRHAVHFVGERPVVIEVHGAAGVQDVLRGRAERRPRGREIFDALDGALDRALDLGLDPLRNRRQIKARGCVHFCSPGGGVADGAGDGGRWVRGGRGAALAAGATPAFIATSIALISFNWPSMFCSRSAIPTICARLGRLRLWRYFSIKSPNCFCAPADTWPAWFMALENSGDDMVWLAKELNPFSISPIIFCHNATGSLPLSAIGVPP